MTDENIDVQDLVGEEALWRLATALAGSATPLRVAEALAQEGGPAAGGVFANMAIRLTESNQVRVVHRSALEPRPAGSRVFDLNHPIPACEAIRSGLPVLLGSVEEIARRFPDLVSEVLSAGLSARASLPLHAAHGEVLGAIGFGWQQPQAFGAPQLRRLDLIAQLAGLALDRALRGEPAQNGDRELGQALESMPNAFFSLDSDLRITHLNAEGARLLGSSSEELTGKRLLDVFPEAVGSQFDVQYRRAIGARRTVVFEDYYAPLDTWFEVHAWPAPHGLNVYFSDISDRRNAERQRSNALTEAMRANSRLRLMAETAAQLSGSEDRNQVFERLTHVLVPGTADWCTIIVPGDDELVRVAARHREPSLDALAKRLVGAYPHAFSGPSPGVVVFRNGEPLRMGHLAQEIVDELDDSAASAAYGRTLQLLGDGPGLLTPVISGDEVQAIITLTRSGGEPFTDADIDALVEVASRVEIALAAADRRETQREMARALQAAALPSSLPSLAHLTLGASYQAASGSSLVGGDWYDAFALASGRVALVVGDVAGHGLGAAALTAQMRNALRAHLFEAVGPLESLSRLSRLIATQEPDAFATIICVELDPASGEATWASAGHPSPIVVSGDGTSAHLQGISIPPIGCPDSPTFERDLEHQLALRPGDRLMLFTDGLFERRNVALDIGLAHLMIMAEQTHDQHDLAEVCETILQGMPPGSYEDDVCLLIADFIG